jgi:spermidine synthase
MPAVAFLLLSGFVAGITQVVLVRELLLACFGNEVALGLMLSAWLLFGAVGTLLARSRNPHASAATRRALLFAGLFSLAACCAVVFIRAYPALACAIPMKLADVFAYHQRLQRLFVVYLAAQPGEMLGPLHLVFISLGGTCLPAAAAGALFTAGLQLYGAVRDQRPGAAGQAYSLDAIGHLAGGTLLGWAAVIVLNVFGVAFAAALALAACAAWADCVYRPRRSFARWVPLLLASALLGASPWLQRTTGALRWQGRELVDQVSSLYGHIAVARQGDEGVVFFENGTPTGLSPALPRVQELVQFAMLQHPRPQRVLLIGGGATGGLQEVLKHNPRSVEYAELDPALLRFAEKWVMREDREALLDLRVERLAVDGRRLVKQAAHGLRERYDVILLLVPDPSTAQLNRYYTVEWYKEARAALNPGGVLAWEMSSSRHYFRPSLGMLNRSILRACAVAFPRKALMTGDDTLAIAAGDERSALTDDARALQRRMNQRHIRAPQFRAVMRDRLDGYNKRYLLAELAKAPEAPANADLAPVGYFFDQAVWIGLYYPDLEAWYLALNRLRPGHLARAGVVLLAVLLAMGAFPRGRRAYPWLAVLATGAAGMALEVCLLFAFQSIFGYVYHQVGIIIGAFMVGLAGGAWLSSAATSRLDKPGVGGAWLAGAQVLMGILAAVTPWLLGWIGLGAASALALAASLAFPLLTALVGFAVGAQFPLAAHVVALQCPTDGALPDPAAATRTASGLYALDLVGASGGSVLAAAALVPVLGIPLSCTTVAALALGMALLLTLRLIRP